MSYSKKNRHKQETFLFVLMGFILLGLIASGYFLFIDKILPSISSQNSNAAQRNALKKLEAQNANADSAGEFNKDEGVIPADINGEGQVITLYFPSRREAKLVSELRKVPAEKLLLNQAENIIRELLRGPLTPETRNCIPSGTQLRSLFFHQGVFYVDFSKEFLDNATGGVLDEALMIYSVVNTLTELDHKAKVKILVNGREIDTIKGHTLLNAYLTRFEPLISQIN